MAAGGARFPERVPGDSLKLAEQAVRSLLRGRLIALMRAPSPGAPVNRDRQGAGGEVGEAEVERMLRALDSWAEMADRLGSACAGSEPRRRTLDSGLFPWWA